MVESTCCFTGHRILSAKECAALRPKLRRSLGDLYAQGVRRFISGAALGFDLLAAEEVLRFREENQDVRLLIAQPCRGQADRWRAADKARYTRVLSEANEVICLAPEYRPGCMQARNNWMLEQSSFVLAYRTRLTGGTCATVFDAIRLGKKIRNLAVWDS